MCLKSLLSVGFALTNEINLRIVRAWISYGIFSAVMMLAWVQKIEFTTLKAVLHYVCL